MVGFFNLTPLPRISLPSPCMPILCKAGMEAPKKPAAGLKAGRRLTLPRPSACSCGNAGAARAAWDSICGKVYIFLFCVFLFCVFLQYEFLQRVFLLFLPFLLFSFFYHRMICWLT
jgi:hypothetical protein